MKLLIGIATYQRPKKLLRLLNSLNNQTYKDFQIVIVSDNNDFDSANIVQLDKIYDVINTSWIVQNDSKHHYVIGAWNRCIIEVFIKENYDVFIGLCDDTELYHNALEIAVKQFKENFPDNDGVLGFHQECPGYDNYTFKYFGQTMIGRKFIERYKNMNYEICCPKYKFLYQDEELFQYANSLDKFYPCKEAIIKHYHPGFIKKEADNTHFLTRKGKDNPKQHDITLFKQRQKEGKLWPLS